MAGEVEVEVARKQRLKLQTDEGSLGDNGTVLLLDGEEMLMGTTVGENDRLTAQGTDLRSANIEDITMPGKIGEGDVIPQPSAHIPSGHRQYIEVSHNAGIPDRSHPVPWQCR